MVLNALALKLIGAVAAALMLFLLIQDRNHWKGKAQRYNAEAIGLWHETRDASGNSKLERRDARQQIGELGKSLQTTKDALARQNAAVAKLGAETARQQAESARAVSKAAGRAKGAEAAAQRFQASARLAGRQSDPCAPSDELSRSWR